MLTFIALLAGLIFGAGLILSGMVNPLKVLGFLDITGAWDPSLALVMIGAIAIGVIAFAVARGRKVSLIGAEMKLPTKQAIDRPLLIGGALFGIGWGIAGFCPGPSIAALGMGQEKAAVFVIALLVGMGLFEWMERRSNNGARSVSRRP